MAHWVVPLAVLIAGMFMSDPGHEHRQRRRRDDPDRARWQHGRRAVDLDRVLARARRGGAGERVARQPLRAEPGLHVRAGRVRARLGAVRPRLEPEQPDRVPDHPGHSGRSAAGDHADDGLPDRAAAEDRHRDGHVRPRHHLRPGHRSGARRLSRRVRELAAGLLHQRPDRDRRADRGDRSRCRGSRASRPRGSTSWASSRQRPGWSRCCWRSPRARPGGGPATGR